MLNEYERTIMRSTSYVWTIAVCAMILAWMSTDAFAQEHKCAAVTAGAETMGNGAYANAGQSAIGLSTASDVTMHAGIIPCLTMRPSEPCVSSAMRWESYGHHGGTFDKDWPLVISHRKVDGTSSFSEPRLSGISEIHIIFSGPTIDGTTAIPANVAVSGTDTDGNPVDLTGVSMAFGLASGGHQVVIGFRPPLPDNATYTVFTHGLINSCGAAVVGDTERCMSAVLGDVNGDLRVAANDVAGTGAFVPTNPIDPDTQPIHARADVNNDGRIQANDVAGIGTLVGHDARRIVCPR